MKIEKYKFQPFLDNNFRISDNHFRIKNSMDKIIANYQSCKNKMEFVIKIYHQRYMKLIIDIIFQENKIQKLI